LDIVSWGNAVAAQKRTDAPYRSGPSKVWLTAKNSASNAVRREREEKWR